ASTRSNATTLWPAWTRLAAIGPPMLPRPMNAIVAMVRCLPSTCLLSRLRKCQLVGADLGKIALQHLRRHLIDIRRRPAGIAVLVDDRGAHAFAEIIAAEHFERRTIL